MLGLESTAVVEIRKLVKNSRPARPRDGYPPDVKRQVVEWALRGREAGLSFNTLATRAGLSRRTLRAWCCAEDHSCLLAPSGSSAAAEVTGTWLPVNVESAKPSSGLQWGTPCGHKVEGLRLDEVAHLLQVVG